ncbi:MAG: UDP-N-acetylglucosamine 1-carboxyvinyltransferase, partial [Patescibacteria group bacterium]|nr:UDP-N-acetylglucosamine 1-carboxyvinyltransferase [Patescibacteria group bacterium]
MSKFIIKGGTKINGEWKVQGMKNAATPVLAASILTREPVIIHNIPHIKDIHHMLEILEDLGSSLEWTGDHTLKIHTPEIKKHEMDYLLTKRMRSSVLLMGPMLATLGKVRIPEPGGCNIGNRPLDAHFKGFEALGAKVERGQDAYYTITGNDLQGGEIELIEKSVTATENVLMAASRIPSQTIIKNAAQEPHIVCLCDMLSKMGAEISGAGTYEISIKGNSELKGVEFEVIPDQLEIGTIAILAALCGGEIKISPVVSQDMKAVKQALENAGVDVKEENNQWIVKGSKENLKAFVITTAPHPGFPTDLQAPFGLLATQANGSSIINDPMYENRLGYIDELKKMQARAEIKDAHTAEINGPARLKGAALNSLDLRAGATLIIAALIADGETVLNEAENIDRG